MIHEFFTAENVVGAERNELGFTEPLVEDGKVGEPGLTISSE